MKRLFTLTPFKISLAVSTISVVAYLAGFSFFETIELKSLDLRFLLRGPKETGRQVALVAIDEKSLDSLGRWPWPRKTIASLIDSLSEYGVKSIGFDIVFAEPEHHAEALLLDDLRKEMAALNLENPLLFSYLETRTRETDNDARLEGAIGRSGRSILGYFFHTSDEELKHLAPGAEGGASEGGSLKRSAYSTVLYASAEAQNVAVARNAFSVESNLDRFSMSAKGLGYFNVFPDFDGTVRWAPLIMRYGESYYPPLSLQLARDYLGDPPLTLVVDEFGVDSVRLGSLTIPTNEAGRLLINYRGGNKTFPHYSADDVLNRRLDRKDLEGKIVIIGATAIGIYDMRVTPFSSVFPGLEIHANIIDNILQGDFLHRPDWIALLDLLILIAVGLLLGLVLPRMAPLPGAVAALTLLAAFAGGSYYAFVEKGLWLNVVYPVFSLLTIYTGITLYHYMTEQKEKKKVRNAFQYYMTSSVVNEVLKDPEKLKLGGDKKELSVLFSDIRSFTTISERMTPENLVHFLNEYLTEMTDIVFEHDGVLDKYMGDAIMAIFGAPLEQKDHPMRACLTALDMMKALKKLHVSWERQGLPQMEIGIGISTGPMVVGNMGSARRFDYTVMGDTVNLGSRLEGINKTYGSNIMISQATYEAVKDRLVCRELDAVRVKGKDQPAKIYELMAERGQDKRYDQLAEAFAGALGHYRRMEWEAAVAAFRKVMEIRPSDPAALLYMERCRVLAQSPPPDGWDGVFTMTTK